MTSDLTNLLPGERHRTLRREYFWRLAVVAAVLGTVLIAAAAILLLPTYLYLSNEVSARTNRLATVSTALASSDEAELLGRLNALSQDTATLAKLGTAPSASAVVSEVLAVPRPGITLSNISYTPAVGNTAASMVISGMAATRDSLRSYQLALQSTSFAQSVDLPVSAYAKDSNISFGITITFSP